MKVRKLRSKDMGGGSSGLNVRPRCFKKVDRKLKGVVIYDDQEDDMMIPPKIARLKGTLTGVDKIIDKDDDDDCYYAVSSRVEPGGKYHFIPDDGSIDIPLDTSIGGYHHQDQYLKLELIRVSNDGVTDVGTSKGVSVLCRGKVRLPTMYDDYKEVIDKKVELVKFVEGECRVHGHVSVTLEKRTIVEGRGLH